MGRNRRVFEGAGWAVRVGRIGTATGLLIAAGMSWGPAALSAQEAIRETRALDPDGRVTVRAVSHAISVTTWDRAEVQVTGEYDPRWERLEVRGEGRSFSLEIETEGNRRGSWSRTGRATLEVRVPAGAQVTLASVSGNLELLGVTGSVEARSVSGTVEADARADRVVLQSVSGGIRFGGTGRDVRLEAVSGSLEMDGSAERLDARSVSGRVRVLNRGPTRSVTLNSVSGSVSFTGGIADGGSLQAESHSGSVELTLPPSTDAQFRLSTFSGRIQTDIEGRRGETQDRARYTPSETRTFTLGAGTGRVEAKSFSGSIRIQSGR